MGAIKKLVFVGALAAAGAVIAKKLMGSSDENAWESAGGWDSTSSTDWSRKASEAASTVSQKAEQGSDAVTEAAESAAETAKKKTDDAADAVTDAAEQAGEAVEEKADQAAAAVDAAADAAEDAAKKG